MILRTAIATVMVLSMHAAAAAQVTSAAVDVPEVEESDVAALPAMNDHWAFVMNAWGLGTRLIDGDAGKMLATLHTIPLSNVAIDPQRRFIYVAETIWTKGNRGARQDMISVYDIRTLKLLREIPLPGRVLTGNRRQALDISADGAFAYVFDMSPATAIHVVDLARRKVAHSVEIPGCAMAFAGADNSVGSLCGDGSLVTLRFDGKGKPTVSTSPAFFEPETDPVFDNSVVDRSSGRAFFLSYSGLVYETVIGAKSGDVQKPWSIQEAGGMPRGSNAPLASGWFPGGRQLMAYHAATGRLFVLMHLGEFWSHKADGTELWVLDVASRKLIARRKLEAPVAYLEVTQDGQPLLFLSGNGVLTILDATTFEKKHGLQEIGSGIVSVGGR